MSEKTKKIIYWSLTGLIAFVFVGSAMGKLTADAKALEMAASMGLDANTYKMLGFIEIISVLLFIFPRTGILGTILLVAFMGGAIATHLENGQSIIAPCVIQTILILVSIYRFPELVQRILNKGK
ncbi:MAG: DoxX family protein [Crocinitomicaceae bacterium]|nr:DoxX family protein [Crocinitomicaceae bacterium]MCF8444793.1 DoxX family protein [Crocinitomicaceae bacterium]